MKSVRVPVQVPTESLTFPLRQAADRFPDKVAVVEPEVGGANGRTGHWKTNPLRWLLPWRTCK